MALQQNDLFLIFRPGDEEPNRKLTFPALKNELGIDNAFQALNPGSGSIGDGKAGFVTPGPSFTYNRDTGVFDIDIANDIHLVEFINFDPSKNDPNDTNSWTDPTADIDKPEVGLEVGSYYICETPCTVTTANWGIVGTNFAVSSGGTGYHVTNGDVSFVSIISTTDATEAAITIPETIAEVVNGGLASLATVTYDASDATYDSIDSFVDGDEFLLDFANSSSYQYDSSNPPIVSVVYDRTDPANTILTFYVVRTGKLTAGIVVDDEEYKEKLNLYSTDANPVRTNIYIDAIIKDGSIERITGHTSVTANNLLTSYHVAGVSGDVNDTEDRNTLSEVTVTTDNKFTLLNTNDKLILTRSGWKHVVDVTAGNYIYEIKHELDTNGDVLTPSLKIDNRTEGTASLKKTYLSIDTVSLTEDGLMPHDLYTELIDLPTEFSSIRDIYPAQEISPDLILDNPSYTFDPETDTARENIRIESIGVGNPRDYTIGLLPTDSNINPISRVEERLRGSVFVAKEEELLTHVEFDSKDLYYSCVPNMELMEKHYRTVSEIPYESTQYISSVLLRNNASHNLVNVVKDRTEIGYYNISIDTVEPLPTDVSYLYTVQFKGQTLESNPITDSVNFEVYFNEGKFDGNAGTIQYLSVKVEIISGDSDDYSSHTVEDSLAIYFHS